MRTLLMKTDSLCALFAILLIGCSSHASAPHGPSGTGEAVAPAPPATPPMLRGSATDTNLDLASRAAACTSAPVEMTIGGILYVGCGGGEIVAVDENGHRTASVD